MAVPWDQGWTRWCLKLGAEAVVMGWGQSFCVCRSAFGVQSVVLGKIGSEECRVWWQERETCRVARSLQVYLCCAVLCPQDFLAPWEGSGPAWPHSCPAGLPHSC